MRNIRLAVVGAVLAAASFGSAAQAATTATATASAEVLSTLSVTATAPLNFGQIAANTGGTVTVNADSTTASTGGLISTGTRAPASFDVLGSAGASVLVSLPTTAALLSYQGTWDVATQGPVPTMSLNGFNTAPNSAFQLNATTGAGAFTVGGTLTVGANQQPGLYSGTFAVSVEYQ